MNIKLTIVALLTKFLNQKNTELLINFLIKKKKINLLFYTYHQMGIHVDGGEEYFINNILPFYNPEQKGTIFFDVGSNVGNYSSSLKQKFDDVEIHCFEPVKSTFEKLTANELLKSGCTFNNFALGDHPQTIEIFRPKTSTLSPLATVYKDVLATLFNEKDIESEQISINTIDNYCKDHSINAIKLLKIDTEGNDLNVLKGATNMIANDRIDIIQFEFNEMNIISRVFLKDFYELLQNFDFYRLSPTSLIPLGPYSSLNEIFQYQNIIAINNNLKKKREY